jgi:hypothetical protein
MPVILTWPDSTFINSGGNVFNYMKTSYLILDDVICKNEGGIYECLGNHGLMSYIETKRKCRHLK